MIYESREMRGWSRSEMGETSECWNGNGRQVDVGFRTSRLDGSARARGMTFSLHMKPRQALVLVLLLFAADDVRRAVLKTKVGTGLGWDRLDAEQGEGGRYTRRTKDWNVPNKAVRILQWLAMPTCHACSDGGRAKQSGGKVDGRWVWEGRLRTMTIYARSTGDKGRGGGRSYSGTHARACVRARKKRGWRCK